MTRILAIRPEPGLSSTLETARAMDLPICGTPLFEIRPLRWTLPDTASFDALLIGSANAMLHGGNQLEKIREKPVYAVGKATARAAEAAGFIVASRGSGGLQNVLDTIDTPNRLLRIAGVQHVALVPPPGVSIQTVIAYESAPLPLDPAMLSDKPESMIVLLHSASAAEHFADECSRLKLDRSRIEIAALGPRIASAAGKNWRAIHVCERPDDAALLEMAKALCQQG
ncbi:uroporphyrinogen-III synthase [Erythrobacter sp. MTPC3]|uniref:uroporphyrinogen-III synthase n=1 Tax=Erythrobacter sp. MTPC3 TaxID=3056564 RepID=UPI0036F20D87